MRRAVVLFSIFAVLALTPLAALAAESKGPAVTGSSMGVLLGLAVGIAFGAAVTAWTYLSSSYGESEAQYEYAHDIREGVGSHEPHEQEVGTAVPSEEEPAGSA